MAADRQREIFLKTKMVLYLKPTAVLQPQNMGS